MRDRKNKEQKQIRSKSHKRPDILYSINPPLVSILKPAPLIYNGKEIKEEEILLETVVFSYNYNIMT